MPRTSPLRCSKKFAGLRRGSMMSLLRGQQGERVPRVGRREQGSNPPTSALGRPPPQERLAAHPPDGCCRLPRLVSGRPHPRAGAAHLRPDSGGYFFGGGGGGG